MRYVLNAVEEHGVTMMDPLAMCHLMIAFALPHVINAEVLSVGHTILVVCKGVTISARVSFLHLLFRCGLLKAVHS